MELIGIPASPGMSKGKLQIILSASDVVKPGHIILIHNKSFSPEQIKKSIGVISNTGGRTSHVAIICRELQRPCITGVINAFDNLIDETNIILDGNKGEIYDNE